MTPKEKAFEIIDEFWFVEPLESQSGMEYHMAIECALIAVEMVISNCYEEEEYYWQEVKQEIEKI